MISVSDDNILRMWNISLYQCTTVIKGVKCVISNALYQIDKDRVIVGETYTFWIVNIDKCVIEKTIENQMFLFIYCFLKLRDNTILCGCGNGIFCFYDMNAGQYKITFNNHKMFITDLLLIDNNTFLSTSGDETIKVWKYFEYFP